MCVCVCVCVPVYVHVCTHVCIELIISSSSLQAYAYYAAHAQAQAAQYYANYPQAAAYARMYQAYGSPYGNTSSYSNTSSYGNQYDSTSYYNYAARAYAAQAQNYSNSPGGHQSEDDSSVRYALL